MRLVSRAARALRVALCQVPEQGTRLGYRDLVCIAGPLSGLDALVSKALELQDPVRRPFQVPVLSALGLPSLIAPVEAGDHGLYGEGCDDDHQAGYVGEV